MKAFSGLTRVNRPDSGSFRIEANVVGLYLTLKNPAAFQDFPGWS
jgi:hypothetical protein